MRLFLIRHGETVDNVAGIYAGTTDSPLTNHGVLQANRLGSHFAATGVKVAHIFSSDLQRAFRTADAIREVQAPASSKTIKLEILREQDFGFYEGKRFIERGKEGNVPSKNAHLEAHRDDSGFRDVESKENMKLRMDKFFDDHLVDLLLAVQGQDAVVVVSHGIILSHLWRVILKRFPPQNVAVRPGVQAADRGFSFEYLGGWSNTGYMELEIKMKQAQIHERTLGDGGASASTKSTALPAMESPTSALGQDTATTSMPASVETAESSADGSDVPQKPSTPVSGSLDVSAAQSQLLNMTLIVMAVNNQVHLSGLKKTRGGIGSLKHDSSQKTMDSFFKKRRLE